MSAVGQCDEQSTTSTWIMRAVNSSRGDRLFLEFCDAHRSGRETIFAVKREATLSRCQDHCQVASEMGTDAVRKHHQPRRLCKNPKCRPRKRLCKNSGNPTNRSWWMFHIQPTETQGTSGANPTNRSWWIVHTQPISDQCCGNSNEARRLVVVARQLDRG